MQRRLFLKLAAVTASLGETAAAKTPASDLLEIHDLMLPGDRKLARRALLLVPRHSSPHELDVLVLLHGLGETRSELLGIHAWGERYGLVTSYERLCSPPIVRTLPNLDYLTDSRLASLNSELSAKPFRGMALVCPVTPNPHRAASANALLDAYAEWITGVLLPAVRGKTKRVTRASKVGLDGCSLGGYVALEVFLRKPEVFSTLGTVQAAIGRASAPRYARAIAEAIARTRPLPLHLETSTQDPYRAANQALSKALLELGVPNQFIAPNGPHNQPWLREVGTLEMLLWHDRQLGGSA